jgi:TIR domain
MTKKIFISYRRADTAPVARNLYDRFSRLIGKSNVFLDVGTIDAGENFEGKIKDAIGKSSAILVLIGKRWVEPASAGGKPRLWEERDRVRAEVRAALQGAALTLPVLVDGAAMPDADLLPGDIAEITKLNAPPLRTDSFDSDMDHIARKALGLAPNALLWEEPPLSRKIGGAIAGAFLAAVLLFVLALLHWIVLHRSISDSIGGDGQMETLTVGILVLGVIAGLMRGSRLRSIL